MKPHEQPCPKCWANDKTLKYSYHKSTDSEHLHAKCKVCGYGWEIAVEDERYKETP